MEPNYELTSIIERCEHAEKHSSYFGMNSQELQLYADWLRVQTDLRSVNARASLLFSQLGLVRPDQVTMAQTEEFDAERIGRMVADALRAHQGDTQ